MANKPVRTSGNGKAGHRSSRWMRRAEAKLFARKARRQQDKAEKR